ncbi:hypothetical protein HYC85_007191 [Camellia sinensis]|uniref:Protein FLX-like 1 n=1 Tax=Camellia sinensis TaxID=4442 RepID=A0A7J7HP58_CAMSI|nr:hypothetical protein HYC85_007191 [Camellia sinensis]
MAGRNHLQPNAFKLREVPLTRPRHLPGGHPALIDDPRLLPPPLPFGRRPPPPCPSRTTHCRPPPSDPIPPPRQSTSLRPPRGPQAGELRHLSAAASDVAAERDAQVRDVYERSLKIEAEVRSIDSLSADLAQVRADIPKLTSDRQELAAKLKAIDSDLVRARSDLQQLPSIKAEIETMHQEVQRGRAAIEYEKKAHASNFKQGQAMEKNMFSMVREIEKLRAELANADKRARAAAAAASAATSINCGNCSYAPGDAAVYGNPEMGYGGRSYPDPYAVYKPREVESCLWQT